MQEKFGELKQKASEKKENSGQEHFFLIFVFKKLDIHI